MRDSSNNFNNSRGVSIVSLGLILLIVSETCTLSSAGEELRRWSPARKERFFSYPTAASRRGVGSKLGLGRNYNDHASTASPSSSPSASTSSSTTTTASPVFEEDKRVVHTGPNPLHN